jgi:hypothetical protein
MARSPRFPVKCEFFTTEEQYEALQTLEQHSLLTKSDHLRQALNAHLMHLGWKPANGNAGRSQ